MNETNSQRAKHTKRYQTKWVIEDTILNGQNKN